MFKTITGSLFDPPPLERITFSKLKNLAQRSEIGWNVLRNMVKKHFEKYFDTAVRNRLECFDKYGLETF